MISTYWHFHNCFGAKSYWIHSQNHVNTVKPNGLEAKDSKNDSGFTPKSCKYRENQMVWRLRIPKKDSGFQKSCKYRENLMVWRLRIPKKILDSLPKSCKYRENHVVWRIRIRTVIFPKLHLYRELEAFVDSCLIRGPSIWTLTGLDRYSSAIFAILTFFDGS